MTAYYIKKLNESDSRKHKESVIEQALSYATLGEDTSIWFLNNLNWCYDPFVTFGVKAVDKIPPNNIEQTPIVSWKYLDALLHDLSTRKLTGNAARDHIRELSADFNHADWNEFVVPLFDKDLKAGVSEKTINKVCKGTQWEIDTFDCQLAQTIDNRPSVTGTHRVERKLDGVRMLLIVEPSAALPPYHENSPKVTCYSRNGKVFENFKHIEEQVAKNYRRFFSAFKTHSFVLDGEVMGNSFQELMKQARRKKDADAADSVYHVFDYMPLEDFKRGYWNKQQRRRLEDLEKLRSLFDSEPNLHLVEGITIDLSVSEGHDQLHRYAYDAVAAGYEGAMIKALEAPYVCKRSDYWLKWKPVYDYDLTVVGIEEGTGRNAGRLGAFICEGTDNGKLIRVNCGSGFSDTDRETYWRDQQAIVGQTAVVAADAITQNQDGTYSLRFPRFVRFRDDK